MLAYDIIDNNDYRYWRVTLKNMTMTPFVKWAGGKRQLLEHINARKPIKYKNYYEPFIGGGAVLFDLQPKGAVIGDINPALINTYQQIRDYPEDVMHFADENDKSIQNENLDLDERKELYYDARKQFNQKVKNDEYDAQTAGLLLFLNKHCFNGLYRCNSKGEFNVPYNRSVRNSYDREDILAVSDYLHHVAIQCTDFANICEMAQPGDFVFLDSPYAPIKADSFVDYTKEGFAKEDHLRLAEQFRTMTERGVYCMLTNHNTPLIYELYQGFNIEPVQVKRMINRDASHRTGEEVIITNY